MKIMIPLHVGLLTPHFRALPGIRPDGSGNGNRERSTSSTCCSRRLMSRESCRGGLPNKGRTWSSPGVWDRKRANPGGQGVR